MRFLLRTTRLNSEKVAIQGVIERIIETWLALAVLAYLVSGVAYLCFGSHPVTHLDFWRVFPRWLTMPWVKVALSRWNGHPGVIPGVLWLADIRLWHGSQQPLVVLGLLLMLLATVLLVVPIWRSRGIAVADQLGATFAVVLGNFWMGRAAMTASGGFNCDHYLALAPAALAFVWLPRLRMTGRKMFTPAIVILLSASISSFSFGTGVAVWPTLILLALGMRLPARAWSLLLVGAFVTVILLQLMPSPQRGTALHELLQSLGGTLPRVPGWFFRLIGSPIAYVIAGWWPQQQLHEIVGSGIAFWVGLPAFIMAALGVGWTLARRQLDRSNMQLVGVALMSFNLGALVLILIGRADLFYKIPSEWAAPRYIFWSTLFWSGLFIFLLDRARSVHYMRWLALCSLSAAAVLAWPSHYKSGVQARFVWAWSQKGATALINGVRDIKQLNILAPVEFTDAAAPLLKRNRLDMFAEGLQDWIGQPVAALFSGQHAPKHCKGRLQIKRLTETGDQDAVQVIGTASTRHGHSAGTLVVVDQSGTVCGIVRPCGTPRLINTILYANRFVPNAVFGYIRDYNPHVEYTAHCADHGALSDEAIPVISRSVRAGGVTGPK